MKITCPYCDNLFNDTLEKCPSCGAPNAGVVRKSGNQPITIEELKDWYTARGLPPYETTRFFIGENYTKPRAFGLYKEEETGNFIVYKNKDSGERAIRYQGTDEAYAVNELYQRLKQEIIQQKRANIEKKSQPGGGKGTIARPCGCLFKLLAGIGLLLALLLIGFIAVLIQDMPKDGYYLYEQTLYYHHDYQEPEDCSDWFWYDDEAGWVGPRRDYAVPNALKKNKQASSYFLSESLPSSRTEPDFFDSILYHDIAGNYNSETGYYQVQDRTYYHLYGSLYGGWYYYDDEFGDWYESDYDDIPYELQHSLTSEDFYYTPTWDSSTQITDFTDSDIYENYIDSQQSSDWDDDYDNDDYDYSWDSGDSWDSSSSDWDSDW